MAWADDGNSFYISNPSQFNQVLGKYFKTRNLSSFIRQLNMYNFSKVRNANGFYEFRNPNFQRGNVHALSKIKRKFVGPKKALMGGKSVQEESASDADSARYLDTRMMILGDQFKRLLETNRELTAKIETLQQEKDEQLKVMSNVIFGIVKSCNTDFMKRIRGVLFDEAGAGKPRYNTTQTQQMMSSLAALIGSRTADGVLPDAVSADHGGQTIFGDNLSDIVDHHITKRFQPLGPRPVVVQDPRYEERSRISVSDSWVDSKTSEGNFMKQVFRGTPAVLDERMETEQYGALEACEMQSLQRNDSKAPEQGFEEKMGAGEEDKDKNELDFEQSRKYSMDLFDGDRTN